SLDAAPIVTRRQSNATVAALDRDPEIPGIGVTHGVCGDFLHTTKERVFLDRIVDGHPFIDLDVYLRLHRGGSDGANRGAEIRGITVAELTHDIAHIAEQETGDRVRF